MSSIYRKLDGRGKTKRQIFQMVEEGMKHEKFHIGKMKWYGTHAWFYSKEENPETTNQVAVPKMEIAVVLA